MTGLKSGADRADTPLVDTQERKVEDGLATSIGLHHAMDAAMATEFETTSPPEPVVGDIIGGEPVTPVDEDDESIAAIRARLAARGLLVQGPAIVVPKEERPDRPVVFDDVLAEAEGDHHPNAVPEDDWDVKSQGAQFEAVRCPQCRGTQQTPIDVTRFRCHTCERAWRWAVCAGCSDLAFTVERQESWQCRCGQFNRSWWRTDVAPRDALSVVARRRGLAADIERAKVRAGMRKRRWKIIAGGVVGLLLVLGFVVQVRASEKTPAAGTAETCRQFEVLRTELGSGTLDAQALERSLDALVEAAGIAEAAVHDPAVELAAIGSPNKAAFLVAQTQLADACTAFEDRD